jgi:hypothetical protein
MKAVLAIAVALIAVAPSLLARIGRGPEDFERFGDIVAESFDKEGNGVRIYRPSPFKEVRIYFANGKSVFERYTLPEDVAKNAEAKEGRQALFNALREENRGEFSYMDSDGSLEIGHGEAEGELKFVRGDGATRTYSGSVGIKKKEDQEYAVLHSDGKVLEIPLLPLRVKSTGVGAGLECLVTVENRPPDDLWSPIAWVGKREHVDYKDVMDDAHNELQALVKIESNGKRIYDRSFCSVHAVAMELRTVEVAFGMLAFSDTERYCQDHFPHYRDFAIGGCVMSKEDEGKKVPIYVCPACVAGCNEYKAAQPEPRS